MAQKAFVETLIDPQENFDQWYVDVIQQAYRHQLAHIVGIVGIQVVADGDRSDQRLEPLGARLRP